MRLWKAKEEEKKIRSYVGRTEAEDGADQLTELVSSQSFSFQYEQIDLGCLFISNYELNFFV